MLSSTLPFIFLSSLLALVSAHGTMVAITGANGITGIGFGVDPTTPRTGSSRNPFQRDTSIIRDRAIARGQTGACGRTAAGNVDVVAEMAKSLAAGVPTAAANGMVSMTIHQVNGDGAGPYSCDIDPTGTGNAFVAMNVVTNVPGRDVPVVGSLSRASATPFPLVAQIPAGMDCTGGNGNVCLIRCRNSAIAGPFGSCAAIAQAGAAGTAVNKRLLETPVGKATAKREARAFFVGELMKRSRVARFLI